MSWFYLLPNQISIQEFVEWSDVNSVMLLAICMESYSSFHDIGTSFKNKSCNKWNLQNKGSHLKKFSVCSSFTVTKSQILKQKARYHLPVSVLFSMCVRACVQVSVADKERAQQRVCLADCRYSNCPCTKHGDGARMLYNAWCLSELRHSVCYISSQGLKT